MTWTTPNAEASAAALREGGFHAKTSVSAVHVALDTGHHIEISPRQLMGPNAPSVDPATHEHEYGISIHSGPIQSGGLAEWKATHLHSVPGGVRMTPQELPGYVRGLMRDPHVVKAIRDNLTDRRLRR